MSNFSDFFPAAGGGGGFNKMNKYSTGRASADSTNRLSPSVAGINLSGISVGITSFSWRSTSIPAPENALIGGTILIGSTTHTVTANTGGGVNVGQVLTITPATVSSQGSGTATNVVANTNFTVNPATNLGLSDGDSIGYMLVGSGQDYLLGYQGGAGGRIIQGTSIISSASTDLVLTPGTGNNVASTISGGLTLTSANGVALFGGTSSGTNFSSSASSGVMGYSAGGAGDFNRGMGVQGTFHGWGNGGGESSSSGDGAILLFY